MQRVDLTRLRWRLDGASMWPVFVVATIAEGFMLNALPVSGTDGPGGLIGALLLATAFNLLVVSALAPLAGMVLRRRRRDLPRAIAADYCGTVGIVLLFAVLLAAGLANRSQVQRDERDRAAAFRATSAYVHSQEREYRDHLRSTTTLRVEAGMYRACVPGTDPERPLCVFVNTDQSPPGVTRDPERVPNALWRR